MDTTESDQKKYFSLFNSENYHSIEDLDLDISENDDENDKKIKSLLMKIKQKSTKEGSSDSKHNAKSGEGDLFDDLNDLVMNIIESGEIDKDILMEGLAYVNTEMVDFMLHEPDHYFSYSKQEKEEVHSMMIDEIQRSNMGDSLDMYESLFPDIIKKLEYMMAKIKTPRF